VAKILGLLATLALALAAAAAGAQQPVTLSANSRVADRPIVLTGAVASGRAGEEVVIEARECGAPAFVPVTRTETEGGGRFHAGVNVGIRTSYRARSAGGLSTPVTIQTRPGVRFEQEGPRRFSVWTVAYRFLAGARGRMERFNRATGKWVLVTRVTLQRRSAPKGASFAYSGAEWRARVPKGTLVRFVLPRAEVGPCYLAGFSVIFNTTQ